MSGTSLRLVTWENRWPVAEDLADAWLVHAATGDSEIDYLAGEVVLQGRLHGVPTPVNDAVVAATRHLAATGGAARSLDATEVLARL